MAQDLKFALRSLRKAPGFTLVAMLIVAIGIGAATTMFSAVDALVLRPVALPDPERLVAIYETNLGRNQPFFSVSFRNYVDWVEQSRTFASFAAVETRTMNLTGQGEPEAVEASAITASFLPTAGIPIVLGRNFLETEDRKGGGAVAILSEEAWARRFGRSPDVLGRTLLLDGTPHVIVGVSGPTDALPGSIDIAVPMATDAAEVSRTHHDLWAAGRLGKGVTLEAADAELRAIAARIYAAEPESDRGWSTRLVPYARDVVGDGTRRGLFVLLGAVGLVLLIACANLSNLLLVRSSARSFEMAIRTALGAGRSRLIRQIVTESLLVTALGGAVGVLVAAGASTSCGRFPYPGPARSRSTCACSPPPARRPCWPDFSPASPRPCAPRRSGPRKPSTDVRLGAPIGRLRDAMVVAQLGSRSPCSSASPSWRGASVGSYRRPRFPSRKRARRLPPAVRERRSHAGERLIRAIRGGLLRTAHRTRRHPARRRGGGDRQLPTPDSPNNTSLNVFPAGSTVVPTGESVQANWRLVDGGYFDAVGIPVRRGRTFAGLPPRRRAARS